MQYRFVRYNRRGKGIKFTPTLELEFEAEREKRARLAPPPNLQEIRQLASDLLGRSVTDNELANLDEVVLLRPHRPDSLLNRLRELKPRVEPPISFRELLQWMRELGSL